MKKKHFLLVCLILLTAVMSYGQNWQTDFGVAKEIAAEENKPIILVFQGSDWCAPCIKLDKEVWSTEEFMAYAEEHFVMLKADFPKRKKNALDAKQQEQNNELAESYNKNGYFPYVVVLNENGAALGSTGYKKSTTKAYIELLESFN